MSEVFFENSLVKSANKDAMTSMSGITEIAVGAPVEYGGSKDTLNPEELFVASINSCLMLVFYHFLSKFKIELKSYSSKAQGKVEKTNKGLRFTEVKVDGKAVIRNEQDADKIAEAAKLAEQYCLVSNSLSCPVEYKVEIEKE